MQARILAAAAVLLLGGCTTGPGSVGQFSGGATGGGDDTGSTGDATTTTSATSTASADSSDSSGSDAKFDLGSDTGDIPTVDCEDEDNPIYVLNHSTPTAIYSFDPESLTFAMVVDVVCPDTGDWTLSSMAVDRQRRAWIEWGGAGLSPEDPAAKRLDRIDLDTGACEPDVAPLPTDGDWGQPFGMAFATASADDESESLYFVDHGTNVYELEAGQLGPFHTFGRGEGTAFSGVELSGTGDGRLFDMVMNYHPCELSETCPTVSVGEIDKTNGAAISTVELPTVPALLISPGGFAFAHWGGHFWIFISEDFGPTAVYDYDPVAGTAVLAKSDGVEGIVGAGVSTCAPLVFPAG